MASDAGTVPEGASQSLPTQPFAPFPRPPSLLNSVNYKKWRIGMNYKSNYESILETLHSQCLPYFYPFISLKDGAI